MRKLLFFIFLLGLTAFAVMDCIPAAGGYGFADYLNILFCNTRQYPLYDRSIWQIINLLFFLAILNTGIYFLSENHYSFSKGFRSLVLIRYEKTSRYLVHVIKFSLLETAKFIGYSVINCFLVLLFLDREALTFTSHLLTAAPFATVGYLILYALKIIFFYTCIQVLVSYFLIRFPYEPILVISLIGTSLLLYADIQFGTNFVTLSLDTHEIPYVCAYGLLFLLLGILINTRLRKKEI